ncbi:hypothetical protein EUGRSUZ_E01204 [Eucalyptus grandis]|uniref:Uncharacterized protein n=2 Tax=Eucalyptus grandis TaxID=71139 RepID=A0ACC3KTK7_EUCGR|nr:hypothetical protein EUGRSUZ_E01204 [Eucalyptus grandis]
MTVVDDTNTDSKQAGRSDNVRVQMQLQYRLAEAAPNYTSQIIVLHIEPYTCGLSFSPQFPEFSTNERCRQLESLGGFSFGCLEV